MMTSQVKSRFLLALQWNQSPLDTGIIVCEGGSFPGVVHWSQGPSPRTYITLYRLDASNRAWSEPIWQHNVQSQLWKVDASQTEITFAGIIGGGGQRDVSKPS
jgi:hypothetical protein